MAMERFLLVLQASAQDVVVASELLKRLSALCYDRNARARHQRTFQRLALDRKQVSGHRPNTPQRRSRFHTFRLPVVTRQDRVQTAFDLGTATKVNN